LDSGQARAVASRHSPAAGAGRRRCRAGLGPGMRDCTPRRTPSRASVRFRATCVIQASYGCCVMPAISTARAGLEMHEKDVADQSAQGQHLDGEEVGCREPVAMSGEERLPGCIPSGLRCGLDAVVPQDRFDRVACYVVAEDPAARRGCLCRPLVGFSVAMRTTSAAMSGFVLGRPGRRRLRAVALLGDELRYQRKMVSGVTIPAMAARRRRPRTLPFTARRRAGRR
jgi:hypothetical protein